MRWLLVKDVQILRRSPLLVALLVIYPIVIAVLIGFALSRGPDKPRVAFVNLVPAEQNQEANSREKQAQNPARRATQHGHGRRSGARSNLEIVEREVVLAERSSGYPRERHGLETPEARGQRRMLKVLQRA